MKSTTFLILVTRNGGEAHITPFVISRNLCDHDNTFSVASEEDRQDLASCDSTPVGIVKVVFEEPDFDSVLSYELYPVAEGERRYFETAKDWAGISGQSVRRMI